LFVFAVFLAAAAAVDTSAQEPPPYSMLDPKPYDPSVDPDIDLFIGNWRDSMPRNIHGSLVVRDILTKLEGNDPLRPARKGACLTELVSVSYASLESGASTTPDKLSGVQELYYILGGTGTLKSGGRTYELRQGSGIVVPPDVEYSMSASRGGEHLTMYLVVEPVPPGFTPKKEVAVRYEFDNNQFISVHWANIDRTVIGSKDGTAVIGGFTAVKIDPMTMAQPHSHKEGVEEVWFAVKGDIKLFMGKEFRDLPPGSAYKVPANGITAHANVNFTDEQCKLIHLMKQIPGESEPYGMLDPKLYDPAVDPDIDMFMGDWRFSMPKNIHGSLVLREILTKTEGNDPLKPKRKGACLTKLSSVGYATLEPGAFTNPVILDGEQEIYYVHSGEGVLETKNKRVELRKGIGFIVPPGVQYELAATGKEHLSVFRIVEPIPAGFTPKKEVVVKDEYKGRSGNYSHWVFNGRSFFGRDDGLAVLNGIAPISLDPMTFGHPHSHGPGVEEVWISLEGDTRALLGKQIRMMPVGAAYKIPPTGITAHSNINASKKPIKYMWMMHIPE